MCATVQMTIRQHSTASNRISVECNTARHGSCGVGKSAYTVQELLSEDFLFEERESLALRTGKAHTVLETAAHTATPPAP
jgi:hypothetical protein